MRIVPGFLVACLGALGGSQVALADTATLDLMKRLSGTSELPAALSSAMPQGVRVMNRKFGEIQGTNDFSGAQIEMTLALPQDLDHSMITTGQIILPHKISVTEFLSQAIGSDYDGSVSCGTGQAYIKVGDGGATVSIAALAHGKALIVQTTESYHRPENQRFGEAVLRQVALATCRMYAEQSDVSAPPQIKPDDPWDFSGITIELAEPDKLVDTPLDSGKAYTLSIPRGQKLNVYDRPNGDIIGGFDGTERELRARYYYTANVNYVWAGMCASNGLCGWVPADYLLSLPPGYTNYSLYRVMVSETNVHERPSAGSAVYGRIFANNMVAVIDQEQHGSEYWSHICRMQSCGWIRSEGIRFEY